MSEEKEKKKFNAYEFAGKAGKKLKTFGTIIVSIAGTWLFTKGVEHLKNKKS